MRKMSWNVGCYRWPMWLISPSAARRLWCTFSTLILLGWCTAPGCTDSSNGGGGPCETHLDCPGTQACIQDLCQQTDPLAVITESLPGGELEVDYQTQVLASGGVGALTWSTQGGPSWLSIDPGSGILTGTPTVSGDVPVTVVVTDEKQQQANRDYVITIGGCTPGAVVVCFTAESGACMEGERVCDADGNLGTCEAQTYSSDANHCGPLCGVCDPTAGAECLNGVCVCGSGPSAVSCEAGEQCCGDACVDVTSDPDNCGDCDYSCASEAPPHTVGECVSSACVNFACEAGWGNCDIDLASNGCEEPLNTVDNCGDCDIACAVPTNAESICIDVGGVYQCSYTCDTGYADCNGSDTDGCECSSPAHATATCNGTSCSFTCDSGWYNCDGQASNGCESTDSNCPCPCYCTDHWNNQVCAGDTGSRTCPTDPSCFQNCTCSSSCVWISCSPGCIC